MFNWQDFKNGEFYVEVTEKNIEDFLSECENQGLKWRNGDSALDFIPEFCDTMYIIHNLPLFNDGLGFCEHVRTVERNGLPFVKWCDYATESEEEEQEETAQPLTWISCAERLPEKSGEYLTVLAKERYMVLSYSVRHKAWNAFDEFEDADNRITSVIAWAEIPPYSEKELQ